MALKLKGFFIPISHFLLFVFQKQLEFPTLHGLKFLDSLLTN